MPTFALPRISAALSALVMGVALTLATVAPADARTAQHPAKTSVAKAGVKHAKAGKVGKHAKAGKHAKGAKSAKSLKSTKGVKVAKHAKRAKRTKAKLA